ncbi:uncharacterized protein LOC142776813 [Rhipicephalus microplus]|uniref:uncharacterized protein LOC142776813 n=1 Tax=Rhipicephalus microplus TaxID=6941 RepID=UPI003F6AF53E
MVSSTESGSEPSAYGPEHSNNHSFTAGLSKGDSPQAEGLRQSRCSGPARPRAQSEGIVVRHPHTDGITGRVAGSAGAPRSVLVDGREMGRTRENLREVADLPSPDTTVAPSPGSPGSGAVPEPPLPRRSTRERRKPRRYPMPEQYFTKERKM